MAKGMRVNQLAKELGVRSEAILARCRDEGMGDNVPNHMSVLSIGLMETVRKWFSGADIPVVESASQIEAAPRKPRHRPTSLIPAPALANMREPQVVDRTTPTIEQSSAIETLGDASYTLVQGGHPVPKPYDTRLVMMVAQRWFETADMNQFCKLIPIVFVDGTLATAKDFPNDGEIWWMLNARTAQVAEPGRLVVGMIENAVRYDPNDQTSSRYQVQRESVHDLELKDGMELIDLPGDAFDNIQEVVSGGFRLSMSIRPTPPVLFRWRSHIYGPFNATLDRYGAATAVQKIGFLPANADMTVYQVRDQTFDGAARGHRIAVANKVSLTAQRRSDNYQLADVQHDLILASGYERVLATNPQKLVLEPIDRKLLRYAKLCLTRAKRQALRELLDELEIRGGETKEAEELVEAIGRIKGMTENQDAALDAVAKAMLESGVLGENRISEAEQAYAEKYVQERTAELQAKVAANVSEKREELRRVEADLKDVAARLQNEEQQLRRQLEGELSEKRKEAGQAIAVEREDFKKQQAELERQKQLLEKNLERVTRDLREAGDEVINKFLTIAPLLGTLVPTEFHRTADRERPPAGGIVDKAAPVALEIPAYTRRAPTGGDVQEEAFFERFRRVVEGSGFSYRPIDLQRFHLSVKCGEMVVLGGPSGTGKSSLPSLYAQALLGEEAGNARPGCLMVTVNPSWMDTKDLLGHMNAIDGRFYPAESGLFQYLVFGNEEHKMRGTSTGIYLVCLDEMNLSQVEHYFGDFMAVLERGVGERSIRCFATDAANPSSPFREYGRIPLSPALRFVGTVNFDETTRLLSDRFLDRVNLIRLISGSLPALSVPTGGPFAKVDGRLVTLADFDNWRNDGALPADLGSILDQMRPLLTALGCPLSPRVYKGICRFVSSSLRLMPLPKAFDIQIAQRVIPKVRGLVTRKQLEALDELHRLLGGSSACSFDETMPLLEEVRDSSGARPWGDSEE